VYSRDVENNGDASRLKMVLMNRSVHSAKGKK